MKFFEGLAAGFALGSNKVNAPDELYVPDNTPTEIANARLNQINRNANNDHNDALIEELERNHQLAEERASVATLIGIDRIALHRTLNFIASRWKDGGDYAATMREAEKYRLDQFNAMVGDEDFRKKIKRGAKALSPKIGEARVELVHGLPAIKNPKPNIPFRPSGPRVER